MIVLGIDPGIATIGFGTIQTAGANQTLLNYGVVTPPAHPSLSSRLDQIYSDIKELVSAFNPDAVAIEELFFNTNLTTGISVAHGRGVILLACYQSGVPVYEYTPLQVKQAVVGYGRAEKRQGIDMVRRILKMPQAPKPDDAADALAIALCHARSSTSILNQGGADICSTI